MKQQLCVTGSCNVCVYRDSSAPARRGRHLLDDDQGSDHFRRRNAIPAPSVNGGTCGCSDENSARLPLKPASSSRGPVPARAPPSRSAPATVRRREHLHGRHVRHRLLRNQRRPARPAPPSRSGRHLQPVRRREHLHDGHLHRRLHRPSAPAPPRRRRRRPPPRRRTARTSRSPAAPATSAATRPPASPPHRLLPRYRRPLQRLLGVTVVGGTCNKCSDFSTCTKACNSGYPRLRRHLHRRGADVGAFDGGVDSGAGDQASTAAPATEASTAAPVPPELDLPGPVDGGSGDRGVDGGSSDRSVDGGACDRGVDGGACDLPTLRPRPRRRLRRRLRRRRLRTDASTAAPVASRPVDIGTGNRGVDGGAFDRPRRHQRSVQRDLHDDRRLRDPVVVPCPVRGHLRGPWLQRSDR